MTQPDTLPYASPRPSDAPLRFSSVSGGVALLFAGLGMILLGGCFLIGIVILFSQGTVSQSYVYWPIALKVLPWVLYALAFGCFATAVWLMVAGVRWLYASQR